MPSNHQPPVALITGAAKRVGKVIASTLHQRGYRVIIHYRQSKEAAEQLVLQCNEQRPQSAMAFQADLQNFDDIKRLAEQAVNHWGVVNALVNNASDYFPCPFAEMTPSQWHQLQASNSFGPYFLTQQLLPALKAQRGSVVNITDSNLNQAANAYSAYAVAKAGLDMMTRYLAKELAPLVRVNTIAPGKTLWPHDQAPPDATAQLKEIPLQRLVAAEEIADAVWFMLQNQAVTGACLAVDAGSSLLGRG